MTAEALGQVVGLVTIRIQVELVCPPQVSALGVALEVPPPKGGVEVTWWGALSVEGRKLDRFSKVIIGFPVSLPSALAKR